MQINKQFIEDLNGGELKNFDSTISQFEIDSRKIKPGMAFVALPGANTDGHKFLKEAYENGANLLVVSQEWAQKNEVGNLPVFITESPKQALQDLAQKYRKSFHHPILCLTGSNGKTTTLKMIESILNNKYNVHSTIGNFNNDLGVPISILAHESNHDFSVLELGTNHFGEIKFLTNIAQPTAGLITNIGIGHVKYLKNREGVARAKEELFQGLPNEGLAFVNLDDNYISEMETPKNKISYSFSNSKVNFKGKIANIDNQARYTISINNEYKIKLPIPGENFAKNALAAFSVGFHYGVNPKEIIKSLENFDAVQSRLNIIRNNYTVIDDSYNANPDSTQTALNTLSEMEVAGQRYFVFGDMLELGEKAEFYHKKIGKYTAQKDIDYLLSYGDYSHIASASARKLGVKSQHYESKDKIIDRLKNQLGNGDIALIKGSRGNKLEKVVEEII